MIEEVAVTWLSVEDVCYQYGVCFRTAKNKIASGTFPVPTFKVGKKHVVDRQVHEQYFRQRRKEGIQMLVGATADQTLDHQVVEEINRVANLLYAMHTGGKASNQRMDLSDQPLARFCWNAAAVTYYNLEAGKIKASTFTGENEFALIMSREAITKASKLLH